MQRISFTGRLLPVLQVRQGAISRRDPRLGALKRIGSSLKSPTDSAGHAAVLRWCAQSTHQHVSLTMFHDAAKVSAAVKVALSKGH